MTSYYLLRTKVLLSDLFMYDESRPQVFRRQPRIFIDPKHQSALHPGKQYANFFSQLPEYPTSGRTCQKYAASTWTASQLVFTKDMSFPSASLPHDLHSERGYAFTKVRMTRVFGLLTARLIFSTQYERDFLTHVVFFSIQGDH